MRGQASRARGTEPGRGLYAHLTPVHGILDIGTDIVYIGTDLYLVLVLTLNLVHVSLPPRMKTEVSEPVKLKI